MMDHKKQTCLHKQNSKEHAPSLWGNDSHAFSDTYADAGSKRTWYKHRIFCPLAVPLWLHSIWSPIILIYVRSSLDMQIHSQAKLESDLCTSQIIVIQAKSKVLVVGWSWQGHTGIYDMIDYYESITKISCKHHPIIVSSAKQQISAISHTCGRMQQAMSNISI
jgi:hypothetical protein